MSYESRLVIPNNLPYKTNIIDQYHDRIYGIVKIPIDLTEGFLLRYVYNRLNQKFML